MAAKPKIGRPKKSDIAKNTKGNRGVRGRPPGDAAIMNEYKAMMLTSPKSRKILEKIADAAMDDDHKNQAAAWKLWMDRVAPVGLFDTGDSKKPSGISINITTAGADKVIISEDEAVDADYEEVQ